MSAPAAIRVRIYDNNGPRGGIDKGCLVQATLPRRGKSVIVSHVDADMYRAIAVAFSKSHARPGRPPASRNQAACCSGRAPADGRLTAPPMSFESSLWRWGIFSAIVLILLAFDLGVLNRKDGAISLKRSLWMSAGYIGVALVFAAWVGWQLGADSALAFLTGYAIEKTLALDNIFLISTVFTLLAVPREYQHRVLFWVFWASSSCVPS